LRENVEREMRALPHQMAPPAPFVKPVPSLPARLCTNSQSSIVATSQQMAPPRAAWPVAMLSMNVQRRSVGSELPRTSIAPPRLSYADWLSAARAKKFSTGRQAVPKRHIGDLETRADIAADENTSLGTRHRGSSRRRRLHRACECRARRAASTYRSQPWALQV
jgi:hypothetical protein